MPRSLLLSTLLLLVLASPSARGGEPSRTPRLSASARHLDAAFRRGGPLALPGRRPMPMAEASVRAQIRLAGASLTPAAREELEALGVVFVEVRGKVLHAGRIYPVRLPLSALDALAGSDAVTRVEVSLPAPMPALVENAPTMTEALPTWQTSDANGVPIWGEGVRVGVLDSWIDPLHPWFFRPDGGFYRWLDVNGNGLFDPAVDAVDLDGDGELAPEEVLRLLKGGVQWDEFYDVYTENVDGGYYPDLDWLYADTNDNGKRDTGSVSGFKESTPAFGEPLFVADDVDHSGTLDLGEKLVMLRTSKLEAVYIPGSQKVYRRGENLIAYPPLYDAYSHATMTIGVLAGGAAPYQRFHGVAPEAEILLAPMDQSAWGAEEVGGAYVEATLWMAEQGAQVLMHEYGSPLLEFGDGSSLLEQTIDQIAAEKGVLSCTAAHNYAGYPMHAAATAAPGETLAFPMELGIYGDAYPPYALYFTLRWREPGVPLTLRLVLPEGEAMTFGEEAEEGEAGGVLAWYSGHEVSDRGTRMASAVVYASDYYDPLPMGKWLFEVENGGEAAQPVDLFMADHTGYFYTGMLEEHVTKAGTISHPATADSALSVGAYRANVDSWGGEVEIGDLSFYSGRGPRIDGERGLDIVGPSDMLAAWWGANVPFYPSLTYAAGTSGSLPQATGVVALLLQVEPELDAAAVRQRVQAGALQDGFTSDEVNPTWGFGKLSAWRTLFGKAPPIFQPPTAVVTAPQAVKLQEPFVLDASASVENGGGGPLQVRWDFGYNGSWDMDFRDELTLAVEAVYEPGEWTVLAEVRDQYGWTDRALARIVVLDEVWTPPQPEAAPEPAPDAMSEADVPAAVEVEPAIPTRSGCSAGPGAPAAAVLLFLALLSLLLLKVCIPMHKVRYCKIGQ